MNTTIQEGFVTDSGDMNYTAIGGYGLFLISELLPFIRKGKENNGLIHTLICLLRGSKCIVDNALNIVEEKEEEKVDEKNIEVVV
jgi:hypothetical protein